MARGILGDAHLTCRESSMVHIEGDAETTAEPTKRDRLACVGQDKATKKRHITCVRWIKIGDLRCNLVHGGQAGAVAARQRLRHDACSRPTDTLQRTQMPSRDAETSGARSNRPSTRPDVRCRNIVADFTGRRCGPTGRADAGEASNCTRLALAIGAMQ